MKIYIREQMYDFKQYHDFLVKPLPETVYDIYAEDEDIEEFFISFFSELNQFPLYVTYEWYDFDFDGMKERLDKLHLIYSHKFIPQNSVCTITEEQGDTYLDVLIFTVKVTDENQLAEVVKKSLVPYHLFIISNQDNVTFGEMYDQEDSIQFKMNESTTFCKMQFDVPATYLVTNQLKNMNHLLANLSEKIKIVKEK
ncbi:hypothetical protein ABET41_08485 [Metabacillus fastidiosus]|uniref:Uncharacterized protein n=1 Tax=Metabacillus fastidiosus TaxID=1458 RepID=A0ABU6NZH0_9BACI|nr:hypothetical protein [Metabacillus fastidiosus]MED4402495.1 hypothetical protein [Metabacillus fastidiosus]MED4461782.1 hypothetical protein [Metabacillus fastidiosus]